MYKGYCAALIVASAIRYKKDAPQSSLLVVGKRVHYCRVCGTDFLSKMNLLLTATHCPSTTGNSTKLAWPGA